MIRVAMTSELSQQRNDAITYFTCSSISRHWELFFQNRSQTLFPKIVASMFVKFISGICKSVIEICRDEVFMVKKRKRSKMDNLDVQLFSLENEASWHAILPHSSFNLFKNVCETYGDSRQPADCQKEGFAVLQTFRSALANKPISFEPLDRFFKNLRDLRLTFLLYDLLVSRLLIYCKAVK